MTPFLPRLPGKSIPGAIESMAMYLASLFYIIYAGVFFSKISGSLGSLLFSAGLGVIPIAAAILLRYRIRAVFRFSVPVAREILGGLSISAGLFIFVYFFSGLLALIFPDIGDGGAPLQPFMTEGSFFAAVLAVAIVPAVTEELLFRGFILTGLESATGKWTAVLLCSCLFGFLHLQPFQIPFTSIIGIGLSYAALESGSLLVPVIMHSCHNLFLLILVRSMDVRPVADSGVAVDAFASAFSQGPVAGAAFTIFLAVMAAALLSVVAGFLYMGSRLLRKPVATPSTDGDEGLYE